MRNLFCFIVLSVLVSSCGISDKSHVISGGKNMDLSYSRILRIEDFGSYIEAVVTNPWDTARILARYCLVDKDSVVPSHLESGTVVVRTPLRKALCYTAVHSSLIISLGQLSSIAGVADSEYITDASLKERVRSGEVYDVGSSMAVNKEMIISASPDAILLSPFEQNTSYAAVEKLGVPIIQCADYMEPTALGRAEWMKFYGLLFGCYDKAFESFTEVENNYMRLKQMASASENRPMVLCDLPYMGTWYVPGPNSVTAGIIEDAAGQIPFADGEGSGSLPKSREEVLLKAEDADVWTIKYFGKGVTKTLESLNGEDPMYSMFKAFKEGNVYASNTSESDFYETVPFRPDLLLSDYISMLHPELGLELRFYSRMRSATHP